MVEKAAEQKEKDERIKKVRKKVWQEQFILTLTSFNRHKEPVCN